MRRAGRLPLRRESWLELAPRRRPSVRERERASSSATALARHNGIKLTFGDDGNPNSLSAEAFHRGHHHLDDEMKRAVT